MLKNQMKVVDHLRKDFKISDTQWVKIVHYTRNIKTSLFDY